MDEEDCWWNETTWTVVTENKTIGRESLTNWILDKMAAAGSVMAVWTVFANLLLASLLLFSGAPRHRQQEEEEGDGEYHRPSWGRVGFSLVQAVIGGVVIPVNLVTYASGRWNYGRAACNAWLLGQTLLVANTVWSLFVLTVDQLVRVASSTTSSALLCLDVDVSENKKQLISMIVAWLLSCLAVLPMALQLAEEDGARLLPDACAVIMTRDAAVLLSLAVFVLPAALLTAGSAVILISKARDTWKTTKPETENECRGFCRRHVTGSDGYALVAVNACCLVTWSPFFVVNAVVAYCVDMCIDPGTWSLLLWIGFLTPAVSPALWAVDADVRYRWKAALKKLKGLFFSLKRRNGGKITIEKISSASDSTSSSRDYKITRSNAVTRAPDDESENEGLL